MITLERALRNIASLTSPTSAQEELIEGLIDAVGSAIERHCDRTFAATSFDELHSGNNRPVLHLRQFPIISIERVAYGPTPVLAIENTSASNQRAHVKVTATGLTLTRVASGVTTVSTVTFAANVTLTALASAVSALGNGWSASAASTFAGRASADLRATQGAFNARDGAAEICLHGDELHSFDIDAERGCLMRGQGLDLADEKMTPVFFGGIHHWRVVYTAGFETIPEAVQEAAAQWVAALYWQAQRDPNLSSESIPGLVARSMHQDMPSMARALLRPYRVIRI